jgi:hypothetical protein
VVISLKQQNSQIALASALILFGLLFWTFPLWGQESWTPDRDYEVFSEPSTTAKKLGVLRQGRTVERLSQGRRWTKIRMKRKGGVLAIGYLRTVADDLEPKASRDFGAGMSLVYSYTSQSGRIYKDSDGNETEISNLSGNNLYVGFLGEWYIAQAWTLRGGVSLRRLTMNGTAKYRVQVSAASTAVELKQEFFSLFLQPQWRVSRILNFWVAPALELAMCSKSTVFGLDSEKPTYFLALAALGTRHRLGSYEIVPELRYGGVINSKPVILNGELLLSGVYTF